MAGLSRISVFIPVCFALSLGFSAKIFAQDYAATVIILTGNVSKKSKGAGAESPVKLNEKIPEGTTLVTKDRSFAKLLFVDNTQMNIGPNSSMQIEKFKANEPGMIKIIDGKIRAQVARDLLQRDPSNDGKKNKLLLHTPTAAMGVRGTDFQINYSASNRSTSLVTFENRVAMVKLGESSGVNTSIRNMENNFHQALNSDRAVMVGEGQFSAANLRQEAPSMPVRISPEQLEALRKNEKLSTEQAGQTASNAGNSYRSPIPPGVDSKQFVSNTKMENVLTQSIGADSAQSVVKEAQKELAKDSAKREEMGGISSTVEGGYVDLNRGVYVAPDPSRGAIFDPTLNIFIPDPSVKIGNGGELKLQEGVHISEKGEITQIDPKTGALVGAGGTPLNLSKDILPPGIRMPGSESPNGLRLHEENLNNLDEQDQEQKQNDLPPINKPPTTDVNISISIS